MPHIRNICKLFCQELCSRCRGLCLHVFLIAALMVFLQLFQSNLLFQRDAINDGSLWLILTGNLVHTNHYHLLMNLAGLSFICFLFKNLMSTTLFYAALLMTMLSVGLGLYFFSTHLTWYAGLSGSLYGLYMVAATSATVIHKDFLTGLPILAVIPAKLAWDAYFPDLTDSSAALIGAPVATDAHLYGLFAGILISFIIAISVYIKPSRPSPSR